VCDMSGTTRDAVDTPVTLPGGERLTLIDTAGIRKRARVADSKDGAESISVDRAMRAMGRAEVVVMVIDAAEGVTQQVGGARARAHGRASPPRAPCGRRRAAAGAPAGGPPAVSATRTCLPLSLPTPLPAAPGLPPERAHRARGPRRCDRAE
jgi:hypothetical protein